MIEQLPIAARIVRNARHEYGTRGTVRIALAAYQRRDVLQDPRRIKA